jgi:hypothetical protein
VENDTFLKAQTPNIWVILKINNVQEIFEELAVRLATFFRAFKKV